MRYNFRYLKIFHILPIILAFIIFYIGNYLISKTQNNFLGFLFLICFSSILIFFIRKYMKFPIIVDSQKKLFYINFGFFNPRYVEYQIKDVKDTVLTSKNLIIKLQNNEIIISNKIENINLLLNLLKGELN
ncbi:hypothetical protein OF820_01690 [Oceanotoga sp. DSM 15011]|jgi:uncharacterized membrane protein YjgN (DUF898 family)|uniref:Uncharacterized protein n=1 Tax=Oceanotoga teriensis TaxID=515440 RepID=A0AA45HHW2_9BACT|nr:MULTISPECIES: hypothetical protein [Oceanotoga]MDN5342316.1 hypothetical protein [Oceanotoga sp.]MDO7977379.1 hypothetical protein [Oceanotoga teriensis]PWJ88769.1 hypothetical protein C7380_11759 [Oceanotoga teriensis]UYP00404.1 hypothetical protein OF820_01690 [Oceanotoga sp. DSM 15011]